jgi:hypothetical protein
METITNTENGDYTVLDPDQKEARIYDKVSLILKEVKKLNIKR